MEWYVLLGLALALLFALLLTGVPVFIAFLVINVLGVVTVLGSAGFGLFANSLYDTATSPGLVTIPLFVLMGEILFRSGTVDVLFRSVDTLVGAVRGRLYVLVVALSTLFGALSGSAVAVAAMLGRSVLPAMTARGYDRRLSAATILGGASLAPIIPPSLLVIVVGSLVKDVSIAGLLIAGILPGLLLAGLLLGYVFLSVTLRPETAPQEDPAETRADNGQSALVALVRMLPFGLIVFMVMGLIMLGIATPSESAATGIVGALATAAVYGRLSFALLRDALFSAVRISAMILIIVASSKLFGQLLAFTGATRGLVNAVTGLDAPPELMLLALMAVPFILCMFIDQIAFMLLAIPLYEPLLSLYGFDPIWFWTLFLINLTVGSLTPPFGYTLFALKGASQEVTIAEVFAAAWPVVGLFLVGLLLLAVFPGIVTLLPSLF